MNANMENTIYGKLPEVAGLNRVQGFDPRKFMRRVVSEQTKKEAFYLDLKFKKLWFRLACPKGRIKTTALKITEQFAIIEAKIYFDRNDKEPAASFIAQRSTKDTAGALYIETAQYAAVDQALVDAGFGLQFADVTLAADTEPFDAGVPAADAIAAPKAVETTVPVPKAAPVAETSVQSAAAEAVPKVQPMMENHPTAPVDQTAVQEEMAPAASTSAAPMEVRHETPHAQPPVQTETVQMAAQTIAQAAPVQPDAAAMESAPVQETVTETPSVETEENAPMSSAYSADMAVDDICGLMTVEDAENTIVDLGTCKGWTLGQVLQRRPASLKWYLNGYQGDNNILRAGAKLLLEQTQAQMAG